jgi:23S rRNA (guanosine2251-2'-O)-methyltransferase
MRTIYGVNPVMEALKANASSIGWILVSDVRADKTVSEILRTANAKGVEIRRVSPEDLERTVGKVRHQGVAAVIPGEFKYSDIEDLIDEWKRRGGLALFLILDSIQDPQNLGSLIRTANAAGATGVIIPKDRACEITPAVVKASAGATEHMMVAREVNLVRAVERLKEANVWVAGVEADAVETIYTADLNRDLALVIGSEGKGIRRLVRESCDFMVSIPMAGEVNSLNAAQAGAVVIFEARRQRLKWK